MMGLWADGWFYISSAGLLISGILFFFLLGQYRVASEAADATEAQSAEKEAPVPDQAVRPVYIPDEAPAAKVASHSEEPPKAEPKPKAEETPVERRRDPATSTGGISPAVVYLQNIKVELADLHKDLRALSKRVDDELSSVSTRDEALIERLGELTRAVEGLKVAAAAPAADEETAKPARKPRKAEPKPEPEPVSEPVVETAAPAEVSIEVLPPPPVDEPLPEPAPAPSPAFSPDETIRMDLSAIVAPPAAAPQPQAEAQPSAEEPAAPAQEAPPAEEKPRRGPVWPV